MYNLNDLDPRVRALISEPNYLTDPTVIRLLLVAVNIVHTRKGLPQPGENGLIEEVNQGLKDVLGDSLWQSLATSLGYLITESKTTN